MTFTRVAILGLGKVGELVADVAQRSGFEVVGYDADPPTATGPERDYRIEPLDVTDAAALQTALKGADAVISCLPYFLNTAVAEVAAQAGTHYFDLTEDVPTTTRVRELARDHPTLTFAPQCGLAPGLIGITGASLAAGFEEIRSIELKVGALPQHPTGLLGYAVNWSAAGIINEYLNDCEVLREGERRLVPAMGDRERVVLGGIELEAALTSGGLGTMCETYAGRAQRLDYKTMRYPGHFEQMTFLFDELGLREDRDLVNELLTRAKPPVHDDVVHLYAAVEGTKEGRPFRDNHVRAFYPRQIGGRAWRAISWTTAASLISVVELASAGRLPSSGFIQQETISLEDLLSTQAGSLLTTDGRE